VCSSDLHGTHPQGHLSMSHKTLHQRILACHFTHLSTDRIARQRWGKSWRLNKRPDASPIVVFDTIKNAMRIVAMAADQRLDGIRIEQTLSDARAIIPDLDCLQHQPNADMALLYSIARWCERYTPLVALSGQDGLFLDITGCAHLFGEEEGLLADMIARFAAQGFGARLAIADTAGAAWAMCRYGNQLIAKPNCHRAVIEPMPLRALRLGAKSVTELSRVGFKTIGCLVDLPRAPIVVRFGAEILQRLDQALGREDEVLSPLRPVSELMAEKRFPEPLVYEEDIRGTIAHLAEILVPSLEKKGLGMRRCELVLFRVDGEIVSLQVEASSPLRDAPRIAALFDERLVALHDEWDAGFGFDVIRLGIVRADPVVEVQQSLVAEAGLDDNVDHLIDRLSARLGADRVQVYETVETHIPERRFGMAAAMHHKKRASPALEDVPQTITRPLVLLNRPELAEVISQVPEGPPIRFRWRKAHYEVLRTEGPERIACEWWKDGRGTYTRDYFRIETRDGHRLWLFRNGLYERETSTPKWYVHGMFG